MALNVAVESRDGIVRITLEGELDAGSAGALRQKIEEAAGQAPKQLVIFVDKLTFMASAGLRVLIFAKQKMGESVSVRVVGAKGPVLRTLKMSGFDKAVHIEDSYPG